MSEEKSFERPGDTQEVDDHLVRPRERSKDNVQTMLRDWSRNREW